MREDEKMFLIRVFLEGSRDENNNCRDEYKSPRDIINEEDFFIYYKRAWYLLQKWGSKGWYDYGVTLDLGWLEEEGIEAAKAVIKEIQQRDNLIPTLPLAKGKEKES